MAFAISDNRSEFVGFYCLIPVTSVGVRVESYLNLGRMARWRCAEKFWSDSGCQYYLHSAVDKSCQLIAETPGEKTGLSPGVFCRKESKFQKEYANPRVFYF